MSIKGVSPLRQALAWIFLGKRLLRDERFRLSCSRCKTKMNKITKHSVIIDICPQCGGLFLDKGEIKNLQSISKQKENKNAQKNKVSSTPKVKKKK